MKHKIIKPLAYTALILSLSSCFGGKAPTRAEQLNKEARDTYVLRMQDVQYIHSLAEGMAKDRVWDFKSATFLEKAATVSLSTNKALAISLLESLMTKRSNPFFAPRSHAFQVIDMNIRDAFEYSEKELNKAISKNNLQCTTYRNGAKSYDESLDPNSFRNLHIGKSTGEFYYQTMICKQHEEGAFLNLYVVAKPSKSSPNSSIISITQAPDFRNAPKSEWRKYFEFHGESLILSNLNTDWTLLSPGFKELKEGGWKMRITKDGEYVFADAPNFASVNEESLEKKYIQEIKSW